MQRIAGHFDIESHRVVLLVLCLRSFTASLAGDEYSNEFGVVLSASISSKSSKSASRSQGAV